MLCPLSSSYIGEIRDFLDKTLEEEPKITPVAETAIYSNEAQNSSEQNFLENGYFQLLTCLQLMPGH